MVLSKENEDDQFILEIYTRSFLAYGGRYSGLL
jgi:hypothetical protein